ncbi:hypothetical protein FRB94_006340 [Tulasnella sp. JGI-2019a]|nr:hypothetical protein FRB94_006340 [Tulasnella sp. JGI-2019a]
MQQHAVHLAGTLMSLTSWGFYICIFIEAMQVLYFRKGSLRSFPSFVITSIFFWNIVNTVCITFTMYRGFLAHEDGPAIYWTLYEDRKIDDIWYALADLSTALAAFSCDLLMIWRTYIVWSRDARIVFFPILVLACASGGCLAIVVYDAAGAPWSTKLAYYDQLFYLTVAVFALNIVTTWYLTSCLVYRLWSMERETRALQNYEIHVKGNSYRRIMRVVIQSGVIYSMMESAILICVAMKNLTGRYLLEYVNVRFIGIVAAMIIVQLNRSTEKEERAASNSSDTSGTLRSMVYVVPLQTIGSVDVEEAEKCLERIKSITERDKPPVLNVDLESGTVAGLADVYRNWR